MKRLVLVDGNALLHRAYHATPPLSTTSGELVNAVYGFTSMLLRATEELHPDYIAVTWDMRAPTFRHEAFAGYKANRKQADDALIGQYDRVHEIVHALNIPEFKLPGFEADDLVGTLAVKSLKLKAQNLEVIIVTGDRDMMQLINPRVKVFMPKKTIADVGMYGEEEFAARFGFNPENLVDYKGLAGDASDNIPGVPGIGEVSATNLVQKYGTLEKIYKHLDELPERQKRLLEEGKESAFQSRQLATLETDVPIKLDFPACQVHDFDREKVRKIFEELEFRSLLSRIPGMQTANSLPTTARKEAVSGEQLAVSHSTTDLDHEVEPILKKMSEIGVMVDLKFLKKLSKDLHKKLKTLEKEIYACVGHEFNINSPKQLSVILFDELHLPVVKKTKTGRSTDEETLLMLQQSHSAVPLVLQYRQLFKLVSTYLDALPRYVSKDGRIHSTFNVEGAATGRLSSQDPNLQNIPIKGDLGSEVRRAFVAPKGKILLAADYSQIELRILANFTGDEGLKKAFLDKIDIHTATAAKVFNVPLADVTKSQRMVGKTVNFATLYGQGPRALSRQLGIDFHTAQDYITAYFEQFPKVRAWMEKVLVEAREKGYVETLWGRKRYIPELNMGNRMMRSFGERAAVNMPIQGTAADMIKRAMVEIDKELTANSLQQTAKSRKQEAGSCQLILQVHDELIFECDPKVVEETARMVKEKMENALELSVPVTVEIKIGPNWGEMKPEFSY